ncbi:MAG: ribonuclease H-like domain-containing protein [candidate division NC10 bacterium]|nr:ribonuclease H-like domain-containing protein [candidate division NC10 bacterium]
MKGYLDIETSFEGEITIIGLYAEDRGMIQLVGPEVTELKLYQALEDLETICTYNGSRFDLPVIRRRLGAELVKEFRSHDLMYDCWRLGLYGGLKRVEKQLGIPRQLKGLDGYDAMRLWAAYQLDRNQEALATLLEYNQEDVLNLATLEDILFRLGCGLR